MLSALANPLNLLRRLTSGPNSLKCVSIYMCVCARARVSSQPLIHPDPDPGAAPDPYDYKQFKKNLDPNQEKSSVPPDAAARAPDPLVSLLSCTALPCPSPRTPAPQHSLSLCLPAPPTSLSRRRELGTGLPAESPIQSQYLVLGGYFFMPNCTKLYFCLF